jgi:polyhydroxybutyrate depolymerase
VLIVVGEIDQTVPGAGGPLGGGGRIGLGQTADRDVAPAVMQADYWAQANGCGLTNTRTTRSYTLRESKGCREGTEVLFYVVTGAGHAWPGGRAPRPGADRPVRHFRASEVMWEFFSRHRRLGEEAR